MANNLKVYKQTKLGKFLYNITNKAGLFLAHHKVLFYILSYTWGILSTLGGWAIFLFVLIFKRKSIVEKGKFFTARYIIFGNNWGGLECGTTFLVAGNMSKNYTIHSKCHELGHTYQAAVWGPFVLFLFYFPSVIRYWYQRLSKHNKPVPYDCIYFEKSASYIGETLLTEKTGKDYYYYLQDDTFFMNYHFGKDLEEK